MGAIPIDVKAKSNAVPSTNSTSSQGHQSSKSDLTQRTKSEAKGKQSAGERVLATKRTDSASLDEAVRVLIHYIRSFNVIVVVIVGVLLAIGYYHYHQGHVNVMGNGLLRQAPSAMNNQPFPSPALSRSAAAQQTGLNQNTQASRQWLERRTFIESMAIHAWKPYYERCRGHDEIQPVTGECHDWLHLDATMIDSLSTFIMLGLDQHVHEIKQYLQQTFTDEYYVSIDHDVNFFEANIRVVAGLLSAYDLTNDDDYLYYALSLTNALIPAFFTTSGLPFHTVNLATGDGKMTAWIHQSFILADIGTFSMEFCSLSAILANKFSNGVAPTNRFKKLLPQANDYNFYCSLATDIVDQLIQFKHHDDASRETGLLPFFFRNTKPVTGHPSPIVIFSIGPMADSYYEYLLKTWIVTGKVNDNLLQAYIESIDSIMKEMYVELPPKPPVASIYRHLPPDVLQFISDSPIGYISDIRYTPATKENPAVKTYLHKMSHFACFFPGVLALGVQHGAVKGATAYQHMKWAEILVTTCARGYLLNAITGLAPETYLFSEDNLIFTHESKENQFNLRPETIESLFFVSRVRKNPIYREIGWLLAMNIDHFTKVEFGYSNINNVLVMPPTSVFSPDSPTFQSAAVPESSPHGSDDSLDALRQLNKRKSSSSLQGKDSDEPQQFPIDKDGNTAPYGTLSNRQESFLLSETLKYLYLLFHDDLAELPYDLSSYVFNTEAHPLRIRPFPFKRSASTAPSPPSPTTTGMRETKNMSGEVP